MTIYDTREGARLARNGERPKDWARWGPYLAERAWGTVREDYSAGGEAWSYFPHDHARSRAYRWNEDGLGGICDSRQHLCFALSLWNGRDPFLKERMFGLTGAEGNHGEDVKDYYFYVDSTPTHSYMKYLYKYPQAEFPYARLVQENRLRDKTQPEFELVDTGIFDESRYFDVVVEYAKAAADDILIRISVSNRGPEAAPIEVLPTLWFRNTWSWGRDDRRPQRRGGRREAPCSPRTGTSASTPSTAPAPTSCSSPRTRRTPRGCTASRRRPPGSRTPSTRASWAAGARPSTRRPPERRPPRAMHVLSAPARRSQSSCAWLQ